jgi:small subunit ribosomal protein S8
VGRAAPHGAGHPHVLRQADRGSARRARPLGAALDRRARILKEEGYIRDYHLENGASFKTLVIDLKYNRSRERAITNLKRISKPGRRIYARKDRLPRVLGGMGVAILSTSNGLITSKTAEQKGVGGEVICFIW